MATNNTKLNRSIVQLLNFTGENVTNNLISASRQKMISISEGDLKKVSAIVQNSIQQSLTNGYGNVEKTMGEIMKESNSTKKSTRKR